MATAKEDPKVDENTSTDEDTEAKEGIPPIQQVLELMDKLEISMDDFLEAIIPMEANENLHRTRRPTLTNVKKTPHCVVFVEWDEGHSLDWDDPLDRDSEGFDNFEDALAYYEKNARWAEADAKEYEGNHLIVFFKDTLDFSDIDFTVACRKEVLKRDIQKHLDAGEIDFLFSGKTKPSGQKGVATATPKASAKAKPKPKVDASGPAKSPVRSSSAKKLAAKRAEGQADTEAPKAPVKRSGRKAPVKKTATTS